MSEWEEKLNTLLSDPDAMAQVMNMAQNLSQQMGQSGGSAPPPPPAGGAAGPAPSAPTPPPRRAIRWAIFRRCSAALTPA